MNKICSFVLSIFNKQEREKLEIGEKINKYDLTAEMFYEYLEYNNMVDCLKKVICVESVLHKYKNYYFSEGKVIVDNHPICSIDELINDWGIIYVADIMVKFKYIDGTPLGKYNYKRRCSYIEDNKTYNLLYDGRSATINLLKKLDAAKLMNKMGINPKDVAEYISRNVRKKSNDEIDYNDCQTNRENDTSSEYSNRLEKSKINVKNDRYGLTAEMFCKYLKENNMLHELEKVTRVETIIRRYNLSLSDDKWLDVWYENFNPNSPIATDVLVEFKYIDGTSLGKYITHSPNPWIKDETYELSYDRIIYSSYELEGIDFVKLMNKMGINPKDVAEYSSRNVRKKSNDEIDCNACQNSRESETSSEYIQELERIKNEYIKAKKELKKAHKKQVKILNKKYKK